MRKTGRILQDIAIGKDSQKDSNNTGYYQVDKWGDVKLKTFCTAKKAVSRVEGQPAEREKPLPAQTGGQCWGR